MSNDPNTKKFKQWLDILQQESWQLELIISGFAIYGLFLINEPIQISIIEAENDNNFYSVAISQGLLVSWYILTINLLIHVILRGLWIGAIGLRYVSGDIDYEKLNYSPKFERHLLKRVGSFDKYVASLEKYCSIIFAITFLLVFYILGLLVLAFTFTGLGLLIDSGSTSNTIRYWVVIPIIVILGVGTVITFIDFTTQGWLKRKKWISWWYYPIYWIFKYLTLSFLYRPIVYNLLDTRFGKRLSMVLVPLYILMTLVAQTGFSTSNYLQKDFNSNAYIADIENYEDQILDNKLKYVDRVSIPSKVIANPFLQIFIVYGSSIEDDVFYFNPELKPEKDKRGIYSAFESGTVALSNQRKHLKSYLATLQDMYRLQIDSTDYEFKLVFTQNKKEQEGFETVLDLKHLDRGSHVLKVSRKDFLREKEQERTIINIPFWYYPEE